MCAGERRSEGRVRTGGALAQHGGVADQVGLAGQGGWHLLRLSALPAPASRPAESAPAAAARRRHRPTPPGGAARIPAGVEAPRGDCRARPSSRNGAETRRASLPGKKPEEAQASVQVHKAGIRTVLPAVRRLASHRSRSAAAGAALLRTGAGTRFRAYPCSGSGAHGDPQRWHGGVRAALGPSL